MKEVKTTEVAVKDTKVKATEVKATETKATKKELAVKTKEVKTEEVKAPENSEKKNTMLNILAIADMYTELGIVCKNPECKGNYRIMKGKSSLNVNKKEYSIYSTDEDLALVQEAVLNGLKDVTVEPKANAQDAKRPNTIRCTDSGVLRQLLKVYATNPANQIAPATTTEVAVAK